MSMRELFVKVPLGNLYIDEILLYYMEPQLFICISDVDTYYLVELVDVDRWIAVDISYSRIQDIKKNKVSLEYAFSKSQTEHAYEITRTQNGIKLKQVLSCEIDAEDLPLPNTFLNILYDNDLGEQLPEVAIQSKRERRDIFDFIFHVKNSDEREMPLGHLGRIFSETQELLYNISNDILSNKGRVPAQVARDMCVCFAGVFPSSVGVRIKSNNESDLLGMTTLSHSLLKLNSLVGLSVYDEQLYISELKAYSPRALSKYRNLMKELRMTNSSLQINMASPNGTHYEKEFTMDEIDKCIKILDRHIEKRNDVLIIDGQFVAFDIKSHSFKFELQNNEIIRGKIPKDMKHYEYELPYQCKISVEQKTHIESLSDIEIYSYKLLKIIPFDEIRS